MNVGILRTYPMQHSKPVVERRYPHVVLSWGLYSHQNCSYKKVPLQAQLLCPSRSEGSDLLRGLGDSAGQR